MNAPARLTWRRYLAYWCCGTVAVLAVMVLCLMIGGGRELSFGLPTPGSDIFAFRLTRVTTAALVGAALAASGVLLQGLLRNPLADPYVLGISTGSSVAVLAWVASFASVLTLVERGALPPWVAQIVTNGEAVPAIIGALLTCVAVFAIARASSANALEPLTLLLVGVVVSAFNGALIILINSLLPEGVSANIITYLIGNISDGTGTSGADRGLGHLPGRLGGRLVRRGPDEHRRALGRGSHQPRHPPFASPHAVLYRRQRHDRRRHRAGPGHRVRRSDLPAHLPGDFRPGPRQLIVTAPFCGAIFLMLADALVQLSHPFFPVYIPVGVVTALAGGPFFLVLLRRHSCGEGA